MHICTYPYVHEKTLRLTYPERLAKALETAGLIPGSNRLFRAPRFAPDRVGI